MIYEVTTNHTPSAKCKWMEKRVKLNQRNCKTNTITHTHKLYRLGFFKVSNCEWIKISRISWILYIVFIFEIFFSFFSLHNFINQICIISVLALYICWMLWYLFEIWMLYICNGVSIFISLHWKCVKKKKCWNDFSRCYRSIYHLTEMFKSVRYGFFVYAPQANKSSN